MLRPLGLEKGKPFRPDARQTKILTDGALVGEAMAKAQLRPIAASRMASIGPMRIGILRCCWAPTHPDSFEPARRTRLMVLRGRGCRRNDGAEAARTFFRLP